MNVPFPSRLRRLALVSLSVLALVAGASAADPAPGGEPTGAKIKIENKSEKKKRLTQVVLAAEGTNEPIEIIDLTVTIDPGKSHTIQSSQFEKAKIVSTRWDGGSGLIPMKYLLASTQGFTIDTHGVPVVTYSVMQSNKAQISYTYTAADLAATLLVPEGQSIQVSNGLDLSGHFPASVYFEDEQTGLPYTGALVSSGTMEFYTVWESGLFDGSGLAGTPRLEGDGDFTTGGTIQLLLSQAQPGGIAVLVAGLEEINVPFAGTTLGPSPRFVVPGLLVDENGGNVLSFTLGEVPPGLDIYAQEFILAGGSLAATNTVHGMSW